MTVDESLFELPRIRLSEGLPKIAAYLRINPANLANSSSDLWVEFSDVTLSTRITDACIRPNHHPPVGSPVRLHLRPVTEAATHLDVHALFEGWLHVNILLHIYPQRIVNMYRHLHRRGVVHSAMGDGPWATGLPTPTTISICLVDFSNARVSLAVDVPVHPKFKHFHVSQHLFLRLADLEMAGVFRRLGLQ
ncbi:hypothetical protein CspHIS471_0102960 [Cutaneotrichosporon sp. HIS471]|nr:hypothetical protein CspHIS471_0102960 [Cutaneotrichosporon sp. HIS471]